MSEVLHLVLKHKYYDMIAKGEKKIEYRSYYWKERVKNKKIVVFHRGYTNQTITFKIEKIVYGKQIQIHLGRNKQSEKITLSSTTT